MNYFILRDGQEFGPYTLGDLQRYVASGNILPTDMARSDGMPQPMMVSQILGNIPAPVQPQSGFQPGYQPTPQSGFQPTPSAGFGGAYNPAFGAGPQAVPASSFYPDPPNLHWALVLLFSFLSCGLFGAVWALIEASWMKKVAPQSKALSYYIGATALLGIIFVASFALAMSHSTNSAAGLLNLVYCVIAIIARFSLRTSIEEHYTTVEPMGIALNGVMTFFFGEIYFQYKFNEINQRKTFDRMAVR